MLVNIDFIHPTELKKEDFSDKLKYFPTFISDEFPWEEIVRIYDKYIFPKKISDGIYDAWNLDEGYFELYCRNFRIKKFGNHSVGSADSKEQILFNIRDIVNNSGNYVLLLCYVNKNQKVKEDFIKWEDCPNYIGNHKKTSEYLKDEDSLTELVFYKIFELDPFTN